MVVGHLHWKHFFLKTPSTLDLFLAYNLQPTPLDVPCRTTNNHKQVDDWLGCGIQEGQDITHIVEDIKRKVPHLLVKRGQEEKERFIEEDEVEDTTSLQQHD